MATKQKTNEGLAAALNSDPGKELLEKFMIRTSELPDSIKGKLPYTPRWLKNDKHLLEAAVELRRFIYKTAQRTDGKPSVENVIYIETSSRPIAALLNEIDLVCLKHPVRYVENFIRRHYRLMDSKLDESRQKLRAVIPPGTKLDRMVNLIRDKDRIHPYNLSPPDAFEMDTPKQGESYEDWIARGGMPAYAIFRERSPDLFHRLLETDQKFIIVDDFVESGETLRDIKHFLKKMKWVHERIGKEWVDGKKDPEMYKKAQALWLEAHFKVRRDFDPSENENEWAEPLDEEELAEGRRELEKKEHVPLDNVYFASLYGHSNFVMPKWVFIGKRNLFPPIWHPSTVLENEFGEPRSVSYSLEAVVRRRGYPWGTPMTEVERKGEYTDSMWAMRKTTIGMPYAPLETPILENRITNLQMSIEMAYPKEIRVLIKEINAYMQSNSERPLSAKEIAESFRYCKTDDKKLISGMEKLGYDEKKKGEILEILKSLDPDGHMKMLRLLNQRPLDLQEDIRHLVLENRKHIRKALKGMRQC